MLAGVAPDIGRHIDPIIGSFASAGNPFAVALADMLRTSAALADAYRAHADAEERSATIAETFATRQSAHTIRLRAAGTALRLLDSEIAHGNHTPAIYAARHDIDSLFEKWSDEADADGTCEPMALTRLVRLQLGAILIAASSGA